MPENWSYNDNRKIQKAYSDSKRKFYKGRGRERITLLEGDAEEILGSPSGPYDFIFGGCGQGQYLHWLPVMLSRFQRGGVLVSDNVLQDGDIIRSRYAVERRNRTIHAR
ncbi:MAG: hypothetical protein ACLR8Q_01495 [[Ruminococcus] lactaris]|uniref:hypothetical protein n=1 Tax=[Ruminococcus] lactaris TaxID=46228 RepID=UPI00399FA8B0